MSEADERARSKMTAVRLYLKHLSGAIIRNDIIEARDATEHLQSVLGSMVESTSVNKDGGDLLVLENVNFQLHKDFLHHMAFPNDHPKTLELMFNKVSALVRMWGGRP
jgi:hypothetical protein